MSTLRLIALPALLAASTLAVPVGPSLAADLAPARSPPQAAAAQASGPGLKSKYPLLYTADKVAAAGPLLSGHNADRNAKALHYASGKQGTIDYAPWQKDKTPNCAALVWDALNSAGAQGMYDGHWGTEFTNRNDVKPGDVVQFDGVRWANGIWKGFTTSHHSGIVVSLQGTQLTILHQNDSTPDKNGKVFLGVKMDTCDLNGATGTIQFFHP
jgi:hypothetical protein